MATISGRHLVGGVPVAGIIVRCYPYTGRNIELAVLEDSTTTDANGDYSLACADTGLRLRTIIDPDNVKRALIHEVTPV